MELQTIRKPVVNGLICAVICTVVSKFMLDFYVITHISIGQREVISEMVAGGLQAVAFSSFFSGFFATYITERWK